MLGVFLTKLPPHPYKIHKSPPLYLKPFLPPFMVFKKSTRLIS